MFSFTGRLNRAPFWLAGIAASASAVLIFLAAAAIGRPTPAIVLALLVVPALIWITLALATKRLHDRDKSGWWLLLFYFAPGILDTIEESIGSAGFIVGLIGIGISIWGLVELGFLGGTAGQNRYGPDPLADPGSA
jgi:uncharacterized membrane protein YhaH (DUF805 family)